MAKRISKWVYVFRVTLLRGILGALREDENIGEILRALREDENIWRRIAIRRDQTLDDLHEAIFDAFDREEEHLYSFYFPRPGATEGRDELVDAIKYTHPGMMRKDDGTARDAAGTQLKWLMLEPGQHFLYLREFEASWWHDLIVESVDERADSGDYPRVLESRGESLPEFPW